MSIPAMNLNHLLDETEYFSQQTWRERLSKAPTYVPEYLVGCVSNHNRMKFYDGPGLYRDFCRQKRLNDPETEEEVEKITFFVLKFFDENMIRVPINNWTLVPYVIENMFASEAHNFDLAEKFPLELGRYQFIQFSQSHDPIWAQFGQKLNPSIFF